MLFWFKWLYSEFQAPWFKATPPHNSRCGLPGGLRVVCVAEPSGSTSGKVTWYKVGSLRQPNAPRICQEAWEHSWRHQNVLVEVNNRHWCLHCQFYTGDMQVTMLRSWEERGKGSRLPSRASDQKWLARNANQKLPSFTPFHFDYLEHFKGATFLPFCIIQYNTLGKTHKESQALTVSVFQIFY